MRCPICKQSVTWEGNPFRPFCSERCRLLDLDNWLSQRYRVTAPLETEEECPQTENPELDLKGERD